MKNQNTIEQVIVIGGSGQTGHRVLELLLEKFPNRNQTKIIATSRAVEDELPAGPLASTMLHDARLWSKNIDWFPLDLTLDRDNLLLQLGDMSQQLVTTKKTVLIFAAAFTNVDGCETDPENCKKINESNTVEVLQWAQTDFNSKLVFYSTDYVFDGRDGLYLETDVRNAISVYGRSKVFVEEWLENNSNNYLILRTTGVFDYIKGSKNFLMQMLLLWGQNVVTKIPEDQLANPVWAFELAQATLELILLDERGIFNIAGGQQLKRSEFAKMIANIFECNAELIQPVQTASLGQKAKRPLKGGLACEKLKQRLGWAPQAAEQVLRDFKKKSNF